MRPYDPSKTPNAREWLALDEAERIALIRAYHERHGEFGSSLEAHAGFHCAVETQIAMNTPEVRSTLGRLRKQGLSRHDAVHAIASVLAGHMHEVFAAGGEDEAERSQVYYQRLAGFNASDWMG